MEPQVSVDSDAAHLAVSAGEVDVPTVHRFGPYRFYFFAHENQETREPPHVHVESSDGGAVFWLEPVRLREAWGYTPREIARLRRIVVGSRALLLRRWDEFFRSAR